MRILLFLALMLVSGLSKAQELSHKNQIIDVIGQERYDKALTSGSKYLQFLNARLEFGYDMVEMPESKTVEMEVLTSLSSKIHGERNKDGSCNEANDVEVVVSIAEVVDQIENGTFNLLKYTIKYDMKKNTYYKLGNTGKVLVIYSADYISKIVNQ